MSNPKQPSIGVSRPRLSGVITFAKLLLMMLRGNLLCYGKQDITHYQPPDHPCQVVPEESTDWELLRKAAILAYRRARKEWGIEFCRTLCHWLENTSFVFIFDAWTDGEDEYTGMTIVDYPHKPAIHIAVRDSNGKPRPIRDIAATLLHEIMHLREKYQHLPNYPDLSKLQEQIREALIECATAGTLDPETANAIDQDEEEQIPWTIEGNALGTTELSYEDWKEDHSKVVHLLAMHKLDIAPPLPKYRTTTLGRPTLKPQELTMSTSISTPTKFLCKTLSKDHRYPTHPISRGVLHWLKVQAQDAIQSPNRHWNGCYPEYLQLKAGTHPDPNPGLIITPNNPNSFNPHILNIPPVELPRKDIDLGDLEDVIETLDATSWDEIVIFRNQTITPELYAQQSLKEINNEIELHEEELQRRQEIKQDLQDHKLDHLPEHIKQNIRNWYP